MSHSTDLIYRLSHDLQAPMRGITVSSGWIVEGLGNDLDEEMSGAVDALNHSVGRMQKLLDGLLDLSRAGRGKNVEPSNSGFSARAAIESSASGSSEALDLAIEGDVELGASSEGFERVVRELIDNAILHTEESPAVARVSIERDGPNARVVVTDEGPGVDVYMGDAVFDLFSSRFGAGSSDHVGVGLTIARAIAEANGGTVSLAKHDGPGARFVVAWPVSLAARVS